MANGRGPVVAQPAHFAAPVGGWNSLSAIAAMPPTDAVRMDNLFPETSYIRLRRGSVTWHNIAGVSAPVRSLMTYSSARAGQRLLAAAGGMIVDVTNKTDIVVLSGMSQDYWQYVNFATPGGQFWIGVNGVNGRQWIWPGTGTAFQGTNTQGPALPTMNQFSMVAAFQSRLFFCSDQDLTLYYLPVNVYQGEMHGIDLGSLLTRGGQVAFLGTWTRDDSTMGMNDLLVVGTTMGEIIVYRGVDPDDPSNWFMVGRFEVGRPVAGHRQLCRLGPDMLMICQDGFQSMSNYLAMGQSKALTTAISQKIGNAVTQAVLTAKGEEGWEGCLYPAKNALIVNVPQPGGGFQQYVVNTMTGAWCRFLGMDAWCWSQFADGLYYGSDGGAVVQGDIGGTDNGVPIAFDLITAFQTFGNIMQQKRACMARPFLIAAGRWYPMMDVNVDYTLVNVNSVLSINSNETNWNEFNWDQADWGSSGTPQHDWYGVNGIGTAFSLRMSGTAYSANLQLMAFDITYEPAVGFI